MIANTELCENVNFYLTYSNEELGWIQWFEKLIKISPKFVYIHGSKLFFFIESKDFGEINRKWHQFMKLKKFKIYFHVRLLEFTQDLELLIHHWYKNIKNLEVKINFSQNIYEILICAPKNLRQFVIGKNGSEIEMLGTFLSECVIGNYQFQIKIL